jgi:hypothetical protein
MATHLAMFDKLTIVSFLLRGKRFRNCESAAGPMRPGFSEKRPSWGR